MTNAPDRKTEGVAVDLMQVGTCAEVTAAARQESIAAQLCRRRQGSYRLEPLLDGRRDPWSSRRDGARLHDHDLHDGGGRRRTRSTAAPRTLRVEVGARTAWLYGRDGRDVFTLLDEVGVQQRQWDWQRRVWMVPISRADDVIAWAEYRQRRLVTVEAVDR